MTAASTRTARRTATPRPLKAPVAPRTGKNHRKIMDYVFSLIADGCIRIDSEGRIWRDAVRRSDGRYFAVASRRAESVAGKGYLRITVGLQGERATGSVMAHRVVWEATNGPIPDDAEINHLDGDKQHNALDNLELVTASGNMQHAYDRGRAHPYELRRKQEAPTWRGRAMLTDTDLTNIRTMRVAGVPVKQIAALYERNVAYVFRLVKGA